MKHKASLTLMELLVMVLVFSLAAAACLGCFAGAAAIHRETERLDRAVLLAQNGAEALKAAGGDLEAAAQSLGGSIEKDTLTVHTGELRLSVQRQPSGIPGLGQALAEVWDGEGSLFRLTVRWQEVA